jgi:hypothetical protein
MDAVESRDGVMGEGGAGAKGEGGSWHSIFVGFEGTIFGDPWYPGLVYNSQFP